MLKYLGEWRAIASFIGWQHLLILLVIITTWHRRLPVSSGSNSSWFALGIASTLYGLASMPWAALVEESPRQRLNFIAAHPEANFYSPETISELSRDWPGQHQLDVPKEIRQIVLVVVESLSAEDSLRTSGLGHRLPRLDQLSRDGVLFDNFLANYSDTEGGVVSLFGGFPPIPYPGGNRSLYKAFEHGQSAVDGLNWMGFHTEFLTTGPLSFLSKGAYLREIGMQRVRGLNEVEDFAAAPRHSFDAPADALLYREALRRIEALEQSTRPYFLALLTVTSHRPPRDPDGRGNNQDFVWEYVDRQLFSFYQELRHQGFFEDGLLLITGDHRKMYPIPTEVQRHYGDSSVARVPLVAVGPGLPAGRIDHRLFQQSDLLRNLGGIAREDQPLTAMATYVERYTLHYTETSAYGGLRVIDAQGRVFPARVFGNRLVWQSEPPQQAASYELELHSQRSEHQVRKQNSHLAWRPLFEPPKPLPAEASSRPGLVLEVYQGTEIDQRLHPGLPRFLHSKQVKQLDFPNLSTLLSEPSSNYTLRVRGRLHCPTGGRYWFRLESDDGAGLAIDRAVVIDADYPRAFAPEDGVVALEAGEHDLELRFFQKGGRAGLRLSWKRPGDRDWNPIPEASLSHLSPTLTAGG